MVSLMSLAIPILLSAIFVFVASSLVHMVLGYHRNDFRGLPDEDQFMEAMRRFNLSPGDYVVPRAHSMEDMKKPEFIEKMKKGPVMFMTVAPPGSPSMATSLLLWFLYSVLVGVFAGYVTSRALAPGAPYDKVSQLAGCTAFIGYSLALLQNSIWYKRNWRMTLTTMFDGLVYGLLTGGTFGWLWPR